MIRTLATAAILALALCSCAKKDSGTAPAASGRHATVTLRDGTTAAGTVVASSPTELTLAGDDRITRTIPMDQVRSVEYGDTAAAAPAGNPAPAQAAAPAPPEAAPLPAPAAARPERRESSAPQAVAATMYEVPTGTEVAVRTDETIDSGKTAEGQTFAGGVTRDVRDASGDVVIPRGSPARIVIKSASKGGHFRGTSDLVLDLQSVTIHGRRYRIDTADIAQRGKPGVGVNKRTAEYTGGGAALGAIIGAIAGGGKGAAIGAASGAGAGAVTQIVTKGGSIKVPAESVLTFRLDKPLRVTEDR
jgi:hypothetical protein